MSKAPVHIMRFAPADYLMDAFVESCYARRDFRTLAFYSAFLFRSHLEGGSLPSGALLAACLHMRQADVTEALATCISAGKLFMDGNRIFHKRVRDQIHKEMEFRAEQAERGEASARTRWGATTVEGTRAQKLARARLAGKHTDEEWDRLVVALGAKCLACGVPEQELSGGMLIKDHVVLISQGGSDSIDNLQPLCRTCNLRKGSTCTDYRPSDWKCLTKRLTETPNPPSPLPTPYPAPSPDRLTPAPEPGPAQPVGPKRSPFLDSTQKRQAAEREALKLCGDIAALDGRDGFEVMASAAHFDGAQRHKVNPASMSDDRLLNTISDLRATLAYLQKPATVAR